MCDAAAIRALATRLVSMLAERSLTIATAESCTGGTVSQAITSVAGCSSVMRGAVVAYHNDVKISVLGVSPAVLEVTVQSSLLLAIQYTCAISAPFVSVQK